MGHLCPALDRHQGVAEQQRGIPERSLIGIGHVLDQVDDRRLERALPDERMSEDIDLRIVGEKANSRGALRRLRGEVNERLEAAGFAVEGHYSVKQNDRYVRYDLPY